jgi:hypothetical protein
MKKLSLLVPFAAFVLLAPAACSSEVGDVNNLVLGPGGLDPQAKDLDVAPNGQGAGIFNKFQGPDGHSGGAVTAQVAISYHGGPVMTGTPKVYYIWYGDWKKATATNSDPTVDNTAPGILENLAKSIGGSDYFKINTTYYSGFTTKVPVSGAVDFGGSVPAVPADPAAPDVYSKVLSDSDINQIVANALSASLVPTDDNAVYFVLTSSDVTASSGFCTSYCGWHTHAAINGKDIKYAFVGNPDRCPSACSAQTKSPNDNLGADAMASIIAHELQESVTDPDLNAWYDRRGYENADKCAWTFGATTTLPNGSKTNVSLGGVPYLIQQNWVNSARTARCAMSL